MTRRIVLRLIEKAPSDLPLKLKRERVRQIVEDLIQIEWERRPEVDPRGGFRMAGLVPESSDFAAVASELDKAGYRGAI